MAGFDDEASPEQAGVNTPEQAGVNTLSCSCVMCSMTYLTSAYGSPSAVLAAIVGGILGCGAEDPADACTPTDNAIAFTLCGALDGKAVSYAPEGVQTYLRGVSDVTFEMIGLDGTWLYVWGGPGTWTDHEPREVSGWLLRPPAGWVNEGGWVCGGEGRMTYHTDESIDATLTEPSILPACGQEGGRASLDADVVGAVIPFPQGGGCLIGLTVDATRARLLTPACPEEGVPLPLDGLRIVYRGAASEVTACIGSGASLTMLPAADESSSGARKRLRISIPSMSAGESCAPAVSGALGMKVRSMLPRY
jgi:hypothetical protein